MERTRTRSWYLDAAAIFLLTAVLIWPLFRLKYMNNWSSIESTFISDARMIRETWNQGGWQPLWYCGTRFDYIYPPALRFGTAFIALYPRMTTARAYHIYIAFFYCVGIAGVYLFARTLFGARAPAWLCAASAALVSPTYLFIRDFRADVAAAYMLPMRMNVLVRYGEGPHMTAFALLLPALAAAWVALHCRRPLMLAGAGVLSALVVSNNFYGATALAMFFPLLCWAIWLATRDGWVWIRAAAIAALAYGLTAYWLTPSYLRITLDNMRLVSKPGNAWSLAVLLVVIAVFAAVTWRFGNRRPERAWIVFLAGSLAFYTLSVVGNRLWNFRVIGEPHRLVPEWDLLLIFCSVAVLYRLWQQSGSWRSSRWVRGAVLIAMLAFFSMGARYLKHAWKCFPADPNPTERVEYQITDWLAHNLPSARVFASGSVRFWFNAWYSIAQVGGGSEQGLLNGGIMPAFWDFVLGPEAKPSVLWMQALAADAIVVNDKESREIYHDFQYPKKFDGVLPKVYDDGAGNRIYQAPRRFADRARVVETARINAVLPPRFNNDVEYLGAYVDAVEHGPDTAALVTRHEPNSMSIRARVAAGQSVLVQETYDPAWHADVQGVPVPIHKDAMGFMVLDAPPGEQQIRVHFDLPLENKVGRGITLVTLCLLAWVCVGGRRRRAPATP